MLQVFMLFAAFTSLKMPALLSEFTHLYGITNQTAAQRGVLLCIIIIT